MLRFGIERARRLVEQQDRRVAENGAGDRKALTLPARETYALLAEKGGEPAWQGVEEFGRMRRLGGGADLRLCGARSAEADIPPRIGSENHRILRHESDALAHLGRIGSTQIDPIDPHGAVLWVVKPQQQLDNRRLASPRRPDEPHPLAPQHGHPANPDLRAPPPALDPTPHI